MTAAEKLFELVKANEVLRIQLEKALEENADNETIENLLRGTGAEQVEEMLQAFQALRQKKILDGISGKELDLNELEMISGGIGGSGTDCSAGSAFDCDRNFKNKPWVSNRCEVFSCCDESFLYT